MTNGAAYRKAGMWRDLTLGYHLQEAVARSPEKTAVVAVRADRAEPRRLTYHELDDLVGRAAFALRALGVVAGDVVSLQLPNGWEFLVAALACDRLGVVCNPLMPIFRERELSFMLGLSKSKVLIVPRVFRGFDHAAMAETLRGSLPDLEHILVVDGEDGPSARSFASALLGGDGSLPFARAEGVPEEELYLLMFTSGTTGEPKGVMHSVNSFMCAVDSLVTRLELTEDEVSLVASPMGHMTGYLAGAMVAVRLGATAILLDTWKGPEGLALMQREGVTYMAGSTPFLADICDAVTKGTPPPSRFRKFLCAGAPIPPVLVERAATELDLKVCSVWGLSESLVSTATEPGRAREKSFSTDGRPTEGMEIQIVDAENEPLPANTTGRLRVRGPMMFMGYYKRPDMMQLDADGWFDSGDLAYIDAEGYVRIAGRIKDLLIRGGENIPVVEVENLLYEHPAVAAVAIVGYPDLRLGERACAFVELRPGAALDFDAMRAYLGDRQLTTHYWPERLELLPALPRTPSGKIQKFKLKEIAERFEPPAKS